MGFTNVRVVTGVANVDALNPFCKMTEDTFTFNEGTIATTLGLRMEVGNIGRKQGPAPFAVQLYKLDAVTGTIGESVVLPISTKVTWDSLTEGSVTAYKGTNWVVGNKWNYRLK